MAGVVTPATDEEIAKWRKVDTWTTAGFYISYNPATGMMGDMVERGPVTMASPVDPKILAMAARIDQLKAQLAAVSQPANYW